MKTLKFKTSINSLGKTLSVDATENDSKKIIEAAEKAGFKIEIAKNN